MWKRANGTYELFVGSRMGQSSEEEKATPFALRGITNLINGKHISPEQFRPDQLHTAALLVDVDGCEFCEFTLAVPCCLGYALAELSPRVYAALGPCCGPAYLLFCCCLCCLAVFPHCSLKLQADNKPVSLRNKQSF